MDIRLFAAFAVAWIAFVAPADAHEVRPAYLELTETAEAEFAVTWKQPVRDGRRLRIDPIFPADCEQGEPVVAIVGGALVSRWTIECALDAGKIRIAGLNRTLTDALVRIDRLDGDDVSTVLRPAAPALDLAGPGGTATGAYLRIGIDHILQGIDHLLFVVGMVLLVRLGQLFLTITAFTIAHSITLAASALAGITLPGTPVEIAIALSISLLALEAIYRMRGRETLGSRWPWLIAFGFGLIHGFGFAGALADIGLPKGAELTALLLFNMGVEIGQIAVVIGLLALAWALSQLSQRVTAPLRLTAAYVIGISGVFWAMERSAVAFL